MQADARALDVATGPGTLPLLAAGRVREIVAVDFSEAMLRRCERNVAGRPNVSVRWADGQELPFLDAFDAVFSLFGLIFFPDRMAGWRGMFRALVPGGVAVVSGWPPAARSTAMVRSGGAYRAAFPDAEPPPQAPDPLDSEEAFRREMEAAGFVDVRVVERTYVFQVTGEDLWRSIGEGYAPLAAARRSMSTQAWEEASARALAWLAQHHRPEDMLSYTALFAVGKRP